MNTLDYVIVSGWKTGETTKNKETVAGILLKRPFNLPDAEFRFRDEL